MRKVSTVVSDATTQGVIRAEISGVGHKFGSTGGSSISGGILRGSTASQTDLAGVLLPPTRPVERNAWGGGTGWALFGLVVAIFLATAPMRMPTANIGVTIVSLVFASPFVALMAWLARSRIGRQQTYHAAYRRDAPLWETAMCNWDNLYYCYRCDGIYYPGSPTLYRTTCVMDVIYSQS